MIKDLATYKREWYRLRRGKGLCVRCGVKLHPTRKGFTMCGDCHEANDLEKKELVRLRRSLGKCPRCGSDIIDRNFVTCGACRLKNLEYKERGRAKKALATQETHATQ